MTELLIVTFGALLKPDANHTKFTTDYAAIPLSLFKTKKIYFPDF